MNKKYCTYVRFRGILGWLKGWSLVGIADEPRTAGYAYDFVSDYAHIGVKMILIEIEPPLLPNFHFVPKNAVVISSASISIH